MKKVKMFFRKFKIHIFLFVGLLIFPLIVGGFYALPCKQVIAVECGDLLAFYSTALGIFSSFVTYRAERAKEKREKTSRFKPQMFVEVIEDEGNDCFVMTLQNLSDSILSSVYLYDTYIGNVLEKNKTFNLCINKSSDESEELKRKLENVISIYDKDLIDEDGYPKYIQICCDVPNGDMWNCCFDKRVDGKERYYYPNFTLL